MNLDKLENKILKLYSKNTRSASNLALKSIKAGIIFKDHNLLKQIVNPYGYTIAHALAYKGVQFDDNEILKLTGVDRSDLNVMGHSGACVALSLANQGTMFESKEIQKLDGVATQMAKNGYVFKDLEILKIKGVAHEMARLGYKFTDPNILKIENSVGMTVLDFQNNYKKGA